MGLAIPSEQTGSTRPTLRRPSFLAPLAAAVLTVALTGCGLVVDRFDPDHPQATHLLYMLDAGSGRARWATEDRLPHGWVASHAPERSDDGTAILPLPYGTEPRWIGTAAAVPVKAPRLEVLNSRTDGGATVVQLRAASLRGADVLTLHADRPVEEATITTAGQPVVTSRPDYPDNVDSHRWPYELRFYDPPSEGITVTLRFVGPGPDRISLSDYTVGLEPIPGFIPRPRQLDRSPDHSSELVVVGRIHQL